MQLERIVIGVDLTLPSTRAALWVAQEFAPDSNFTLLHCLSSTLMDAALVNAKKEAEELLGGLARKIGTCRCEYRVRIGDAARCLADLSTEVDADLIAVGAHEEHPERQPALGTTAQRLVRCAPVPVLLCSSSPSGTPSSVLLPIDAVEIPSELAEWTGALAEMFDATLALVHVEEPEEKRRLTAQHPPRASKVPMTPWSTVARDRPSHRVFVDAVLGDRADALLGEARRFHSDLVMLQAAEDEPTAPDGVTDRVLRSAECPVLVIPSVDVAQCAATR
jgi:nucleotide-binding universal stress UspA family protein